GEAIGTPHSMAPEQVLGDAEIDGRADVWALGVVLYEMVAGEVPTRRSSLGEVLSAIVTGQIRPLDEAAPGMPADLAALVGAMLSVRREARPGLDEVRARLAPFARGEGPERVVEPTSGGLLSERFDMIERVATGGMGTVYRARDRVTGQPAAVKIIRPSSREAALRLVEEATVLARLDHPGIVRYIAHGPADGEDLYLAMEWLSGEDLAARLARGPLSTSAAVTLCRVIAEALGAAHACGVVHRDLKPSNLFLPDGDVARAKILDFGIARRRGHRPITRAGTAMGTPGYMAPEQVSGDAPIDARADVFALGCVLYEALAGRPAFAADTVVALLAKTLVDGPPLLGQVRPDAAGPLEALVARMLSKSPAERPDGGAAVAAALAALPPIADGDSPPRLSRPEALTDDERWLVSVILAGAARPAQDGALRHDATQEERDALRRVRRAVGPFLGRAELLADGAIVVTLLGIGTATDQAAHAARAALAIRAVAPELALSLATGHSAAMTATGSAREAIDQAAALLARAPAGQVIIDDLTAGLLDGRFEIDHRAPGARLGPERESFEGPRTLLGKAVPCVGRERELGALLGIWDECVEEQVARAVLLTGVPGIGKSRLRHEVLRRVRARSPAARVLFCQGDPITASAPYSLLGPALRRAMGVAHGEPAAAARAKICAAMTAVAPDDRDRVVSLLGELMGVPFPEADHPWLVAARSDAIVHADQVRRAWEDFVQAEGAAAPWLFVIEDLHWGDPPSARLIEAALRHVRDTPLLVLALARPEVDAVFPDLWAGRGLTRMELLELSRRAGARLVREVLGPGISDADVDGLVEQAGGNALYLEELVRAASGPRLDEAMIDGPIPRSARGRRVRAPTTVTAMVQSRIEALATAERRALRAGSILGNSFWLEAVDLMLGGAEPLPKLDATLRRLVDREVLVRVDRSHLAGKREYAFRHALLREAAYEMLTEEDRALGHRLAADFLERAGEAEAAVIAEHYRRGGARERAALWYRRAAEQALEANDFAGAIERGEQAASCGATGEALGAVRLRQAEAYQWLGDAARTEAHALDAADLLPEGSDSWATAMALAACTNMPLGRKDRAIELTHRLLRPLGAPAPARSLLLGTARVAANLCGAGRPDLCAELLEAVAAGRRGADDPMLDARVLAAEGQLHMSRGAPDLAGEAMAEAARAFERAGDRRTACIVRVNLSFTLMSLGAYEDADAMFTATLAEAERMGLRTVVAAAKHNLGLVRGLLGRLEDAARLEREAIAENEACGDRRLVSAAHSYAALIHAMRCDLDRALEAADAGLRAAEPRSEQHAFALAVRARLLVRRGRPAEALAAAREAHALRRNEGILHEGEVLVRLAYAEALHLAGDVEGARAVIAGARDFVNARAAAIEIEARRASFLARVPENARVLALAREWLGHD
ncbi:MAG: protein kinase, partial [Polyangiaceae bacterium]|nr:protein kinase [Polyangiaceae bacterium]